MMIRNLSQNPKGSNRGGIDPVLFVLIYLEPAQGADKIPFRFNDRVVGMDIVYVYTIGVFEKRELK